MTKSALEEQIGGDHYKKLGKYQPWEVLSRCFSKDEFRGFMIGTVIAYLMRNKNGREDVEKAEHTLRAWLEMTEKSVLIKNHKRIENNPYMDYDEKIDEYICSRCKTKVEWVENYDSSACLKCNTWLDEKCNDDGCIFCLNRPDRPYENEVK